MRPQHVRMTVQYGLLFGGIFNAEAPLSSKDKASMYWVVCEEYTTCLERLTRYASGNSLRVHKQAKWQYSRIAQLVSAIRREPSITGKPYAG